MLALIRAGKHCEPKNRETDCSSGDNDLAKVMFCCSRIVSALLTNADGKIGIPFKLRKNLIFRTGRGCRVSITGDTQNPTGHSPEQPAS